MNWNLIRVLFPRWAFFEKIGHRFDLEFKVTGSHDWNKIDFSQTRQPLSFFINPEANLAMAHVNIIEHFVSDLQDSPKTNPLELRTYPLLSSLILEKVKLYEFDASSLQFRILARKGKEIEPLFYSNILKVKTS